MIRRRVLNSSDSPKPKCDIILDSGAYSAWRLGKPVNITEYCDFLLANQAWMGHYVCLDVINPGDPEAAAAASFENLLYMRSRGLDPVPVYHVGEDISWLFRMLDLGCAYIGLSASSLVSRNQVDDWYAMAWSHLVTPAGRPIVRAHAFGEGRLGSMLKFPWYSTDSTSWIYDAQRNGAMTMPGGSKVVHRNDGRHTSQAQDIDQMAADDRDAFHRMLVGFGIRDDGFLERGGNVSLVLRTYIALMDCLQKQTRVRAAQPIAFRQQGFIRTGDRWQDSQGIPTTPFKYHLVMGSNHYAAACLAYAGYENALASYFYIMNKGFYTKLGEFAIDPKQLCDSTEPFKATYEILKEYVNVPVAA